MPRPTFTSSTRRTSRTVTTYLLNLMKGPQMAHILRSENAIATGDYLGGRSSQANVIST